MKVLWLSHLVPYPPKGGVLQRSHHLVRELARYHEVDLLAFNQKALMKPLFPSVEAGLKSYVGAAAFETDEGYGSKVLAEYKKLQQVSSGKKVPTTNPVIVATPAPAVKAAEPAVASAKMADSQLAGL